MNLRSGGLDPVEEAPTTRSASVGHLIARAVVNELHARAPAFDKVPDLRGVQITVKFDPSTGTVRGVWSSIEAGGYRRNT